MNRLRQASDQPRNFYIVSREERDRWLHLVGPIASFELAEMELPGVMALFSRTNADAPEVELWEYAIVGYPKGVVLPEVVMRLDEQERHG